MIERGFPKNSYRTKKKEREISIWLWYYRCLDILVGAALLFWTAE